jgi:hypothetical protein
LLLASILLFVAEWETHHLVREETRGVADPRLRIVVEGKVPHITYIAAFTTAGPWIPRCS